MHWELSYRADPLIKPLADRHYNRQNPDSPQFVPPGRCVVLRTRNCDAFWVTSAPFAKYVRHQWAGAWMCTAFRNESAVLSSTLISEAVAASLFILKRPPEIGFITFVNSDKIKSCNPGYCFKQAGWKLVGFTEVGRLHALQLESGAFPPVLAPIGVECRALAVRARKELEKADARKGGRGHKVHTINGRFRDQSCTSRAYLLRALARHNPDILERYERGEFKSVRAAALAAGIIKTSTPLDRLNIAWAKVSEEERATFLKEHKFVAQYPVRKCDQFCAD